MQVPITFSSNATGFALDFSDVATMRGPKGDPGGFYVPSVSADGELTWAATDDNMPAIPAANIKGAPGRSPVCGTDYFTESDKAQIVSDVLATLPIYNGEVADA